MLSETLLQMAATKSTKDAVNEVLDDFEKLTRHLFESLSATSLRRSATKTDVAGDTDMVVCQLIAKDRQLQTAVQIAKKQMDCQHKIQAAKVNVSKKDQEILQLEHQLKEAEKILSQALYQAKNKLSAIDQANKGSVSSEELIKYAHKISSSNAVEAPTTWSQGDPRRPYPLDIEMRSGLLGRLGEGTCTASVDGAVAATSSTDTHLSIDGVSNGQSSAGLSWQSHLHVLPNKAEQQDATNETILESANGRSDNITTEFMSSSSCSSSSDSP